MLLKKLFELFESIVLSFLSNQKEAATNKILFYKISKEAKNIPYVLAGIFIFSVILGLAIFSAVLGMTTFYSSTQDVILLNTWNLSSIALFILSAMIAIPLFVFINSKQREILKLQNISKVNPSVFSPFVNEIKKESIMLLEAVNARANKTQVL